MLYRKIFPSFQWEDKWLVNQIINLPDIIGVNSAGFVSGVPPETVRSSDWAIAKWIQSSMNGCSCLVLFVGETTYQSRWVRFELEEAKRLRMGSILVRLEGMKRRDGSICSCGRDPYEAHGLYGRFALNGYRINSYSWLRNCGKDNLGKWIDDAVMRAQAHQFNSVIQGTKL